MVITVQPGAAGFFIAPISLLQLICHYFPRRRFHISPFRQIKGSSRWKFGSGMDLIKLKGLTTLRKP